MKAVIECWEDYIPGVKQERTVKLINISPNTTIKELLEEYSKIGGMNGIFIDVKGSHEFPF